MPDDSLVNKGAARFLSYACRQRAGESVAKGIAGGHDRRAIGQDLMPALSGDGRSACHYVAQWAADLWEIQEPTLRPTAPRPRADLPIRGLPGGYANGFIKKTRATPEEDLAIARGRKTEIER